MNELQTRTVMKGMVYGEGIRWYGERLWVSDIYSHEILRVDPDSGQADVVAHLDDRPSGLGFQVDGTLLAVTMLDHDLMRVTPDGPSCWVSLSEVVPGTSVTNDMVVDGAGRAYIGFHAFPDPSQGADGIVLVRPDGQVAVVAEDLQMPNGMAVAPDGRLFVAETRASRIIQFRVGPDGTLSGRTTFAELPGHKPDGIAVDRSGRVWVSSASSGQVLAVSEGGSVSTYDVPGGRWPVALVFGGPGRRRLFVVTSETTTEDLYRVGRHLGKDHTLQSNSRIDWCDVGAEGAGWP